MWTEIFKEKIKKEKLTMISVAELMGMSETAFHKGFKSGSFKIQNVLKVFKYYGWDLNLLIEENIIYVNEPKTPYELIKKTNQNDSTTLDKITRLYDDRIYDLKEEIKTLKGQLEFLQELIRKNNEGLEGAKTIAS